MDEVIRQKDSPGAERRKIRKGTQSCWECKRRKVRCVFGSLAYACNDCRRRGSTCITQDYPDKTVSASSNGLEGRLRRVEGLLEQLLDQTESGPSLQSPAQSTSVTLEDGEKCQPEVVSSTTHTVQDLNHERHLISGIPWKSPSVSHRLPPSKHQELARDLIAAWPIESDIEKICSLPTSISLPFFWGICKSASTFADEALSSTREILNPPESGKHPVLIARKLLVLGIFLQGIPPSCLREFGRVGVSVRSIMSRVTDRAISLVTTNEDLIRSVEGMECIVLEAVYQNYAGNLHRAWMAIHRATAIAQMMALHRGLASPSLKFLEPETRAAFNPAQTYFLLIQRDRSLSIMLGLPHTSLEDRFSTPEALEEYSPNDRMQHIHCAVAGRIIERNNGGVYSLVKVQEDDMLLRKAADDMAPQWWLIPNFIPCKSDSTKVLRDTVRIMDQLTHYHMLIRLHLPYIFSSSGQRNNHSKITAINASREILSRYNAFRTSNPAYFYCRGSDFLAFIATNILCISHINSRSQFRGSENSDAHTGFESLVHSRPSDRGSMECALGILESKARDEHDLISGKLTRIIHHLLTIEANAARGDMYNTSSSKSDDGGLECDGRLTNDGKTLQVHIPYFGAINFERGIVSKSEPKTEAQPDPDISTMSVSNMLSPVQPVEHDQHPSGYDVMSIMGHPVSRIMPVNHYQLPSSDGSIQMNRTDAELPDSMELLPDEDDLQGIDLAFFDGLFCGAGIGGNIEDCWIRGTIPKGWGRC